MFFNTQESKTAAIKEGANFQMPELVCGIWEFGGGKKRNKPSLGVLNPFFELGVVYSLYNPFPSCPCETAICCSNHLIGGILTLEFIFIFLKDFVYLFMRGREREREREGEASTHEKQAPCRVQGARRGTWSRDPRITLWAKGRRSTTEPPRDPLTLEFKSNFGTPRIKWNIF